MLLEIPIFCIQPFFSWVVQVLIFYIAISFRKESKKEHTERKKIIQWIPIIIGLIAFVDYFILRLFFNLYIKSIFIEDIIYMFFLLIIDVCIIPHYTKNILKWKQDWQEIKGNIYDRNQSIPFLFRTYYRIRKIYILSILVRIPICILMVEIWDGSDVSYPSAGYYNNVYNRVEQNIFWEREECQKYSPDYYFQNWGSKIVFYEIGTKYFFLSNGTPCTEIYDMSGKIFRKKIYDEYSPLQLLKVKFQIDDPVFVKTDVLKNVPKLWKLPSWMEVDSSYILEMDSNKVLNYYYYYNPLTRRTIWYYSAHTITIDTLLENKTIYQVPVYNKDIGTYSKGDVYRPNYKDY